jgi:hypothetical protein
MLITRKWLYTDSPGFSSPPAEPSRAVDNKPGDEVFSGIYYLLDLKPKVSRGVVGAYAYSAQLAAECQW